MQVLEIPVWKQAPFVRALIPLVIGILLSDQFQIGITAAVTLLMLLVVFLMLMRWLPLHLQFKWQHWQGVMFHLLFFSWGITLMVLQDQRLQSNWYGHFGQPEAWKLQLLTPPEEKAKTIQLTAEVIGVFLQKKEVTAIGKIKLLLEKDSNSKQLLDGDILLIGVKPVPVMHSGNPGAFNYKRWLQLQQIYEQAYVPASKWQRIYHHDGSGFFHRINRWQQQIRVTLKKYLGDDVKVLGIAEALLIGYKADLDPELVQSYSSTGVVHIIAISGLHLGLIYWVLQQLLRCIPFLNKKPWLKALVILSALWIFSLLTGASASVLRSAVMFTIIVIGESGNRQSNIVHSLAASAFLLLLYNPFLLWDAGFQLSYLAIIGIISLQKPIENLFFFGFKPFRLLWQMCSVTIAAQVFTTPIALFYFHQFPNYFLAANLPAVPLSTIILFAELLLLLTTPFPVIAHNVAQLCHCMIKWLNLLIESIHHWPYAVTDYIPANALTTFVLYLFLLLVLFSFKRKKAMTALLAAGSFLLFWGCHLLQQYHSVQQRHWVVLQSGRSSAMLMMNGRNVQFLGDTLLLHHRVSFNRLIRPALLSWRQSSNSFHSRQVAKGVSLLTFSQQKLLWINQLGDPDMNQVKQVVDFLLISGGPDLIIDAFNFGDNKPILIFDGSNPMWKIAEWKKQCDALHLRYVSIPETGAFHLPYFYHHEKDTIRSYFRFLQRRARTYCPPAQ